MNDFIKNKIKWKHKIYKTCSCGRKDSDYVTFLETKSKVSDVISKCKE